VSKQQRWLPYAGLAALGLIWGASFLFIKVAVRDLSPEVLVAGRIASAAATLALMCALGGRNPFDQQTRKRLPTFAVLAVVYAVLPWTLISWGEQYIPSGLTSILNATTPLFTALLAFAGPQSEKPHALNLGGIAVGFAGTLILIVPTLSHGLSGSLLGAIAVLGASAAYAVSYIIQRRRLAGFDGTKSAFWQMTLATLIMLPLAAPTLSSAHPHLKSVAAVLALGVVGSGLALAILYYLLNTIGATRTSALNFLPPISAVIYGALLLHEQVTAQILLGMAVILGGVFLVMKPARTQVREEKADAVARA
jgi:drug/metabolite transporter (DMT)-like permease